MRYRAAMTLFRRAAAADIPAIMEIERGEGYELLVARSGAERHAAYLSRADVAVWVGEDGGAIAGFAIVDGIGDPHSGPYLRRIATRVRGAGHGRALLAHVMAFAFDEAGAPRFWLDVFAHNEGARRMYAKAGLREEGMFVSSYAMDDGSRADRVVMAMTAAEWRALRASAPSTLPASRT